MKRKYHFDFEKKEKQCSGECGKILSLDFFSKQFNKGRTPKPEETSYYRSKCKDCRSKEAARKESSGSGGNDDVAILNKALDDAFEKLTGEKIARDICSKCDGSGITHSENGAGHGDKCGRCGGFGVVEE